MVKIEDLFTIHDAQSEPFRAHKPGSVAFVTNGLARNGILGYVKPRPGDTVFDFIGLAISAFGQATIQIPLFVARGNGGSGMVVLESKKPMTVAELGFVAAHINTTVGWRFSWSRLVTVERLHKLEIADPTAEPLPFRIKKRLLPLLGNANNAGWRANFKQFSLASLYHLKAGDYHNASVLPRGTTPLVSCGDAANGISAFVTVPEERVYKDKLTVAFNGMNTLTAKYHPYRFAAKDDVAVCSEVRPLRLSTHILVQLMLNRERWRYSYYRKCFIEKLRRFSVKLPARAGDIDEDSAEAIMQTSPYWNVFSEMA